LYLNSMCEDGIITAHLILDWINIRTTCERIETQLDKQVT